MADSYGHIVLRAHGARLMQAFKRLIEAPLAMLA